MARPEKKMLRKRIVNAYLSSVISISLVLLLTGIAALLVVNAHGVTKYLKENMHISVLLRDEATEGQARAWATAQESLPYVHSTRVITREEGAEELKTMLGEDFLDVFVEVRNMDNGMRGAFINDVHAMKYDVAKVIDAVDLLEQRIEEEML